MNLKKLKRRLREIEEDFRRLQSAMTRRSARLSAQRRATEDTALWATRIAIVVAVIVLVLRCKGGAA